MAVEQASASLEEKKRRELLSEVQNLTMKLRIALSEASPNEIQNPELHAKSSPQPGFIRDLCLGLLIFAVTGLCFLKQVPILGDPLALLAAPVVTLLLSWRHRP
jgi:hypothetical protein